MSFNLQTHPTYNKKLLAIVSEISTALNAMPNVRFYIVGGAPIEYILSEDGKPIYDIDGVGLINPDLPEAEHTAIRVAAMETAAGILKRHLEGLMAGNLAALATEAGADFNRTTPSAFGNNTDETTPVRLAAVASVSIPPDSPLTGIYYYDATLKMHVLSVRFRKTLRPTFPPSVRNMQSLIDISFPARDYPGYKEKWVRSGLFLTLRPEGIPVRSLNLHGLRDNAQFAAEHTPAWNIEKQARRFNRSTRLTAKMRTLSRMPQYLPTIKATFAVPPAPIPRTGGTSVAPIPRMGGGSASAAPVPTPHLSIYLDRDGRVFLSEHRVRRSWPAREPYDPYMPDKVYSFETGFRGPIGASTN